MLEVSEQSPDVVDELTRQLELHQEAKELLFKLENAPKNISKRGNKQPLSDISSEKRNDEKQSQGSVTNLTPNLESVEPKHNRIPDEFKSDMSNSESIDIYSSFNDGIESSFSSKRIRPTSKDHSLLNERVSRPSDFPDNADSQINSKSGTLVKKQSFRFSLPADDDSIGGSKHGYNGFDAQSDGVIAGSNPESGYFSQVPSYKFPSPNDNSNASVAASSFKTRDSNELQIARQSTQRMGPSPPKGFPSSSASFSAQVNSKVDEVDTLPEVEDNGSTQTAVHPRTPTTPSANLRMPIAGLDTSQRISSPLRPISREEVRRMVIPTYQALHSMEPEASSTVSSFGETPSTVVTLLPSNNAIRTISRPSTNGKAFAVVIENESTDMELSNEAIALTADVDPGIGDLFQHPFYSEPGSVDTNSSKLEFPSDLFRDRPGTHERPSSTQTKYMSLYANDLPINTLRLQTPKAVLLSQEDEFAADLELSHRSVASDLTADGVSVRSGADARRPMRQVRGTMHMALHPAGSHPNASASSALPFPFKQLPPVIPHVDAHVSNPHMHFDQLKTKVLTADEEALYKLKMKYLKRQKKKEAAARRELRSRLQKQEEEDSIIAEFSHIQIDAAMHYFHSMCVGLSQRTQQHKSQEPSPALPWAPSHEVGGGAGGPSGEIRLNELEAVVRKYRRAQVSQEEEQQGRGLLVSLEWLLEQLDMSPMAWFELTDTTRVNKQKLAEETTTTSHESFRFESFKAAHTQMSHTKGNGKLSYQELVLGIDMLCDKLSEKLTYQANKGLKSYAHLGEALKEIPPGSSGSPGGLRRQQRPTKVVVPYWKRSDIHALLKFLDPNSDGDISAEELQLAFQHLHGEMHSRQLMAEAGPVVRRLVDYLHTTHLTVKDLFRLIDTDRSETISAQELFIAMKSMRSTVAPDHDERSVGSVGLSSIGSIGSQSMLGLRSDTLSVGNSGITRLSTDFRSPFRYVDGSRAVLGCAAFGKQQPSITLTKVYDLVKLNKKAKFLDSLKDPRRTQSPEKLGRPLVGSTLDMDRKAVPLVASSLSRLSRPQSKLTNDSNINLRAHSITSRGRQHQQPTADTINHSDPRSKVTAEASAALLDPKHRKKVDHYTMLWERQFKCLNKAM